MSLVRSCFAMVASICALGLWMLYWEYRAEQGIESASIDSVSIFSLDEGEVNAASFVEDSYDADDYLNYYEDVYVEDNSENDDVDEDFYEEPVPVITEQVEQENKPSLDELWERAVEWQWDGSLDDANTEDGYGSNTDAYDLDDYHTVSTTSPSAAQEETPRVNDIWERADEQQWYEPVHDINATIARLWQQLRRRRNGTRSPAPYRNRTRLRRGNNTQRYRLPRTVNATKRSGFYKSLNSTSRSPRVRVNKTMAPTRDHSYVPPDIRNRTELQIEVEACARRSNDDPLKRADCGLGYTKPTPQNGSVNWRVFFIGEDWTTGAPIRKYSGCPKRCPLSPRCGMFFDTAVFIHGTELADVVVAPSYNYLSLKRDAHPKAKYRVIYWREASWTGPPQQFMRSPFFSFEMGVHLQAALRNPVLIPPPHVLLRQIPELQALEQIYFVASVISDCGAKSKRDDYVIQLSDALGTGRRVHRYGKCGGRKLPGERLQQGLRRLSRYKFYLAFENTIQDGYLTEKLFAAMMLPNTVPVYYGAPHKAFNITKKPSFIRATDFSSPKALADELIRVASDEALFKSYLEWKKLKNPFTDEFLEFMATSIPGPEEILIHGGSMRSALCCRLCNRDFVQAAAATKSKSRMYVDAALTPEQLTERYFKIAIVDKSQEASSSVEVEEVKKKHN